MTTYKQRLSILIAVFILAVVALVVLRSALAPEHRFEGLTYAQMRELPHYQELLEYSQNTPESEKQYCDSSNECGEGACCFTAFRTCHECIFDCRDNGCGEGCCNSLTGVCDPCDL